SRSRRGATGRRCTRFAAPRAKARFSYRSRSSRASLTSAADPDLSRALRVSRRTTNPIGGLNEERSRIPLLFGSFPDGGRPAAGQKTEGLYLGGHGGRERRRDRRSDFRRRGGLQSISPAHDRGNQRGD